jgi:cytochrome c biogenesis protein CcmG/thiol:disulfide interchange protein DsbE
MSACFRGRRRNCRRPGGKVAPAIALPALDDQSPGFCPQRTGARQTGHRQLLAFVVRALPAGTSTLMELAKREGVTLYGVDYKEGLYGKTDRDARGFLDELGNPFSKINKDAEGRVSIDWGVTGVPETFVIDGNGVIRVHYAGPLNERDAAAAHPPSPEIVSVPPKLHDFGISLGIRIEGHGMY